ncbi:hypothetical protein VitviT2T_015774 [Vitis vinifera]|uniref:Uncharacterized protein n=1 Tax=Vitis vinifera TaxID=29760 RepID=A5BL71_VITVI|nr:hypothetical protein VitviT2T_015774 [Vitis vinifera]CAN61509.1 hypothetical protein VITISV_000628 [Vitis vinifera]
MAFSYRGVPVAFDRGTLLHKVLLLVFQWQVPVVEWLNQPLRRIHLLMNASHPLSGALLLPPSALTFVSTASAPACSTTYAITAQSLTVELKWIAAGRIATDESRSAADSLAVRFVPQRLCYWDSVGRNLHRIYPILWGLYGLS